MSTSARTKVTVGTPLSQRGSHNQRAPDERSKVDGWILTRVLDARTRIFSPLLKDWTELNIPRVIVCRPC